MKILTLIWILLIAGGSPVVTRADIDDMRLKDILETMFLDRHQIKDDLYVTLSDINFASNRLVNAAKAVYEDPNTDFRQKGRAINVVSEFGETADVDFVMSCATNHDHWYDASIGVVNMLGPTTNALSRLESLMRITAGTNGVDELSSKKSYVVWALLERAKKVEVPQSDKELALGFATSFASNHVNAVMVTDMALCRFDPTFKNSRRRLELLRYLQPRETIPDLQVYVNAEIGKLESLPEGDLEE